MFLLRDFSDEPSTTTSPWGPAMTSRLRYEDLQASPESELKRPRPWIFRLKPWESKGAMLMHAPTQEIAGLIKGLLTSSVPWLGLIKLALFLGGGGEATYPPWKWRDFCPFSLGFDVDESSLIPYYKGQPSQKGDHFLKGHESSTPTHQFSGIPGSFLRGGNGELVIWGPVVWDSSGTP